MAFEEIRKKGMMDVPGAEGEVSLVAGRSQREKRRSYKDLLREEEEIAAQVCKTSKKHHKDSELFLLGGDSHKKKKKHSSDDYYHRDHHSSGQPPHKKKRKSSDRSPSLSSSSSSHPSHTTDTAMGLLEAITSPLATGSEPAPHLHKKPSYPPHASLHSSKERKREGSSKNSSHSYPHSRPPSSSSSKKHSSSSKSLLFHGGAAKGEPLTLCEAEGLKMKLVLSSKEKSEGAGVNDFPGQSSSSSSGVAGHLSSSSSKKGGIKKEKDKEKDKMMSKPPKKKQHSREPLPVVGKEVEVVGHYSGSYADMGGESSSSGGELEAGELVIDDSYTHLSKKKKKSKKSKKKKDKERDRDREKGSREKKHSKGGSGGKKSSQGDQPRSHSHTHSSSNHSSAGGMYPMAPPTSSHQHQSIELIGEKKKKKEEKERDKHDKDKPKKKNMTAYQVFCKEYRVNINAEQPGLVFGELSKKLAEVWKQLPEKDKLVWRQKAQYLQHKQNKAEAMTVKRKTLTTSDSKTKGSSKAVSLGTGLALQGRSSLGMSLSPARVPDVDPIDAAAHLQLLGESLSLIGHRLQETEGMVAVSGSLSVLLDSILCALGPLTCLTAQVPQLNGCPRNILSNTLDNIAYIMPGL
ncbi:HMG domain-containing protein 4a isoform X1 [Danio aesculapii]|uniref:HMG domain-containing protein 4a isoform X1 n=1 Tax=Danio aesculapii TaxID=1142201 RepID=UPI0024C0A5C4|nr:HMG domain-containing protein 4a isoform X1 [Danio aesculapii]XP_056309462.1 HMG domain-containing protein 4a isoform X1 [Danio aesculapii]